MIIQEIRSSKLGPYTLDRWEELGALKDEN